MEKREEKNPMTNSFEQNMLLLLGSSAEIFPLLKEWDWGLSREL